LPFFSDADKRELGISCGLYTLSDISRGISSYSVALVIAPLLRRPYEIIPFPQSV
jgi:hypothetical protein